MVDIQRIEMYFFLIDEDIQYNFENKSTGKPLFQTTYYYKPSMPKQTLSYLLRPTWCYAQTSVIDCVEYN